MTTETTSPLSAPSAQVDVDYRAVLVPLDGSDLAELAIEPARWLAEQFGAQLHLATFPPHQDQAWWHQSYLDSAHGQVPEATVSCSQQAHPADGIVGVASGLDPCLVCMATHGRARSAAILGSTFSTVGNNHRGPLLAIGPRSRMRMWWRPERIAACVSGSLASETVLPLAAAWARRLRLGIDVVTVAEPAPGNPAEEPQHYVDTLAERPELSDIDVRTQVLWSPLSPHDALARHFAQHPSYIAAATSRVRTGFARMAHGSETALIIQTSPVPVLVQPDATPW